MGWNVFRRRRRALWKCRRVQPAGRVGALLSRRARAI